MIVGDFVAAKTDEKHLGDFVLEIWLGGVWRHWGTG
jgi:hypothetical protein